MVLKSSLMKLLAGQGEIDEGTLWIAPGTTVAYLPQAPLIPEGISLRDIVVENTDISAVGHKADNILKLLNLDPYRTAPWPFRRRGPIYFSRTRDLYSA